MELNDGSLAGVGDLVITRRNDRCLQVAGTRVGNGDRWKITKVRDNGSVTIRPVWRRYGGPIIFPSA